MAQRRGDAAKTAAINTILNTFEDSFLLDKKIYITVKDGPNGEPIQLAIALTMPKNPVIMSADIAQPAATAGDSNAAAWESAPATPTELSQEDKAKIEELCKKLGI